MKEVKIYESFKTIKLINQNELIYVNDRGDVIHYNHDINDTTTLFNVAPIKGIEYSDGGFDLESPISIYVWMIVLLSLMTLRHMHSYTSLTIVM